MASTKFYLDLRSTKNEKPMKISITHRGETALLPLGINLLPSQWDKKTEKIISHPNKVFLNTHIAKRKLELDTLIVRLMDSGKLDSVRAVDLKNMITGKGSSDKDSKLLHIGILRYAERQKCQGTRRLYMQTYRRVRDYDPKFEKLKYNDVTVEWLDGFEDFLSKTAPSKNARNINLRNIRAVFNRAIDDGLTTHYPFRKFKIRPVPTAKRSLTVEQLRRLFSYPVEDYAVKHLDMFKLMFYLIGINLVDLYNLTEITSDGRVEYYRAKTGRLYSVKLEPEAMEIIRKYRGSKNLVSISDTYGNHGNYNKHINRALQRIGEVKVDKRGVKNVKPLFPKLTTYWTRHTWATIAASLDIPKETIAAALGHGGNTVTDIYIDFDRRKVDEANRKVMDWVLYGKR